MQNKDYTIEPDGKGNPAPPAATIDPRIMAVRRMHVDQIPVDQLRDILGDMCDVQLLIMHGWLVEFALRLPTRSGETRKAHHVTIGMQPTGVVGIWVSECGTGATIEVLRQTLVNMGDRWSGCINKLDAWIRDRSLRPLPRI